MTVYIHPPTFPKNNFWTRMACDGDVQELHDLAEKTGISKKQFVDGPEMPYYHLRLDEHKIICSSGAYQVSEEELVKKCRRKKD